MEGDRCFFPCVCLRHQELRVTSDLIIKPLGPVAIKDNRYCLTYSLVKRLHGANQILDTEDYSAAFIQTLSPFI